MEEHPEDKGIERVSGWEWFAARAHGKHALFWLAFISFLEPIILPIVPESLMVAMILAGRQHWKKYALITTVFSTLGGLAGYCIGAFLFHQFGALFLSRYELHQWFHTVQGMLTGNILLVMLFITFTPVPDKAFVILAGFFHVAFIPYAIGFFLGRGLRFGLVAYLVHRFGGHVFSVVRRYFEVFAVLVVIIVAYIILHALHIIRF